MFPMTIGGMTAMLVGAILVLIWLYIAARLCAWGAVRSWFEGVRKFGNNNKKRQKQKEEEENEH